MNPTRFDTLTKSLATSISRRKTLKSLVVTTAGGLFGLGTLWKISTALASNSPLEVVCQDQNVHVLGKQQAIIDHDLKTIGHDPESRVFCGPDTLNSANGSTSSFSSTSMNRIVVQAGCPSGQTICHGICCAPNQGCSRFTGACCNPSGSVCDLSNPGACCSGICINGAPPRCA